MPTRENELHDKEYNVRIIFTSDGTPVIGRVDGFYKVDTNIVDILPVSESTIRLIAKALHIQHSTTMLNAKMAKRVIKKHGKTITAVADDMQLELFNIL
jgi:hypothetical protein